MRSTKFLRRCAVLSVAGCALATATLVATAVQARATGGMTATISTIMGTPPHSGFGPAGPATSTALNDPEAVAVDSSGDLYVADTGNCAVWKLSGGDASLFAGDGTCGDSGDGGPAVAAELNYPTGLAVDASGDVFIADGTDCTVREVPAATGDIATVAGTGSCGSSTAGGPATSVHLDDPSGLSTDTSGNLYIADSGDCTVWKLSAGSLSSFAGTPGSCGLSGVGGPATAAKIGRVADVAVDSSGNAYLADPDNCTVWGVASGSGTLSVLAGLASGQCGDSGDGGPAAQAELGVVTGVAVDGAGDVFMVMNDWCVVREVFPSSGDIATVVGSAPPVNCGFSGDGGPATQASLLSPREIAVDASGDLYIADSFNNAVREVTNPAPAVTAVNPPVGPIGGGEVLTVTGTGLSGTTAVSAGGVPADSFGVLSSTELSVTVPAHVAGTVDIRVTTLAGTSPPTASDQFTYSTTAPSTSSTTTSTTVVSSTSTSTTSTTTPGASSTTTTTVPGTTTSTTTPGTTSTTSTSTTEPGGASSPSGYWLVASDGGIFTFGDARFFGSTGALKLARPIVGMAATPDGGGYWLVASDGGIFTFGDANMFGSLGGVHLTQPIVGMAATPDGGGYWLVASDGGIFTFGDARFFGSTSALKLARPIVGMAATPDGGGYWLVASDGGIFTFGDANMFGSLGGVHLTQPIVSMAATPDGGGYWLVASDGGIFAFGDANFYGSEGGTVLAEPIENMVPTPGGGGYWEVASDGGIFAFGDANFYGSEGGTVLTRPVVGMAATPHTTGSSRHIRTLRK